MNAMMIVLSLALAAPAEAEATEAPGPNEVLQAAIAKEKDALAELRAKQRDLLGVPVAAEPEAAAAAKRRALVSEAELELALAEAKQARLDAERGVRVQRARCAVAEAIGVAEAPNCDAKRIDGTPARASTLTVERVDGLRKGGPLDAPVPEPVAELLGLVTEIAVERAKQNGLAFLQRRIRRAVCGVELPWVPGTPSAAKTDGATTQEQADGELAKHSFAGQPVESKPAFPATCQLLTDVPLDQLAEDPRRILPALVADLVGTIGTTTWAFLRNQTGSRYAVVAPAIDIALRLAVVSRLGKANSPSSTEVLAVLNTLLALRCSTDDGRRCKAGTWAPAPAVAIALEVLAELVARGGKGDVATLVAELSPTDDSKTIARAVELAAIGVRALGLDEALDARDPKAQWTAAMAFVFESAIDLADHAGDSAQKVALEHLRDLTVAAADENIPAAVSAGASLLHDLLESRAPCTHGGTRAQRRATRSTVLGLEASAGKTVDLTDDAENTCEQSVAIAKVTALLGGVASYSATYTVDGNGEKTAAELRASRKEALESLIDATTKRTNRGGDWVISLGIPVGFSIGGQWGRTRDDIEDGGTAMATGKAELEGRPEFMPPQVTLALGFGIQKLVGHPRRPTPKTDYGDERIQFNGVHAFVSLIDLGQFLAYDDAGKINRPRWDSLFSPGAQLGWAFGTPANTFVVAGEVRYAPTLFAGTSGLDLQANDVPGGALRLGVVLAYYVSLFDFN